MNGHDYNASTLGDPLEDFYDHEGARGVQTRSGLVQEEDNRVVDNVYTNRDPAALSAGNSSVPLVADDRPGGSPEAELVDQGLDPGLLLGLGEGPREAELGREHERLLYREHGVEEVVLHNVG
eukprot:TRINITY_DN58613_c0_g1_i1.p3 TRINITY_DN58613_c0_g1~~TRINITY_DN58613_c0_g1_i1.p3  ORF type:complete len:123 (+),score=18.26 TRINITY_DN58613_c0_g1_i1:1566-1934(+)